MKYLKEKTKQNKDKSSFSWCYDKENWTKEGIKSIILKYWNMHFHFLYMALHFAHPLYICID